MLTSQLTTFWLSLGFNNKNPLDSIEKTCGKGQRKIFGAVLVIYWMFLPRVNSESPECSGHSKGQGFLSINRILCFWVASRQSVSGILHSRSWRSKSHLSAQPKPQEAGIFKVLVWSFLSKTNLLPLPFDQKEEKIFEWWSAGFQSWEDLQLQVKRNLCFHLMIPFDGS